LQRAKEAAKTAVCLSNQRQVCAAMLLYAGDNDGIVPRGYTSGFNAAGSSYTVRYWYDCLADGFDGPNYGVLTDAKNGNGHFDGAYLLLPPHPTWPARFRGFLVMPPAPDSIQVSEATRRVSMDNPAMSVPPAITLSRSLALSTGPVAMVTSVNVYQDKTQDTILERPTANGQRSAGPAAGRPAAAGVDKRGKGGYVSCRSHQTPCWRMNPRNGCRNCPAPKRAATGLAAAGGGALRTPQTGWAVAGH